jgi:hypothetical protein
MLSNGISGFANALKRYVYTYNACLFSLSVFPVLAAQLPLICFVCRHCFDILLTTNGRNCILFECYCADDLRDSVDDWGYAVRMSRT